MTFFEFYAVIGSPLILLGLMALVYYEVDTKLLRFGHNRNPRR